MGDPRYVKNSFTVSVGDGSVVTLTMHDTSGDPRYRSSSNMSTYNHAEVLIFVFDVTSKASLKDFDDWKKTIIRTRGRAGKLPVSLGLSLLGIK